MNATHFSNWQRRMENPFHLRKLSARLAWCGGNLSARDALSLQGFGFTRVCCLLKDFLMRSFSFLIFVLLTILCWGMYGPVLHEGQALLGEPGKLSRLKPFLCVGIAYFFIAVVFPLMKIPSEGSGQWTVSGSVLSFVAGAIGALGALGIILAFMFGGSPIFVMPLVFGCAPVINTLVTMIMGRSFGQASLAFFLGILVVAIGGAGVMYFKPTAKHAVATTSSAESEAQATTTSSEEPAAETAHKPDSKPATNLTMVVASIVLTALCWGAYGPILHKGQAKMGGSRLRPFLLVGLAYFVVAVALPLILQAFLPPDPGAWNMSGTLWSLIAGAIGAIGALGIIYAFNFGGKPIYVMPLVFGGAPVVNTLYATTAGQLFDQITLPFYISLFLVMVGAVVVLTCAPRPQPKQPPQPELT